MNTFDVTVLSPRALETVTGVVAFAACDSSGEFALRAHHERFVTVLLPGLARLRCADESTQYLAQPGAVLHFADDGLTIAARDFLRSADFETVSAALGQRFATESRSLCRMHDQLERLEREMLRRMRQLEQEAS